MSKNVEKHVGHGGGEGVYSVSRLLVDWYTTIV